MKLTPTRAIALATEEEPHLLAAELLRAIDALRRLRDVAASAIEGLIEMIDQIVGDPDLEPDDSDSGIEDQPHDEADEGNDEPD